MKNCFKIFKAIVSLYRKLMGLGVMNSHEWLEISQYLELDDILSLRLVNKAFNRTFSSDDVWAPLAKDRWFDDDDHPGLERLDGIDLFEYYYQRNIKDSKVVATLNIMKTELDPQRLKEMGSSLVKSENIPILKKLRRDRKDLVQRYLANSILFSIRKQPLLSDILQDKLELDPNDLESFFLRLSDLDPARDDIIQFRKQVIDSVVRKVRSFEDFNDFQPPTFKVNLIVEALRDTLSPTFNFSDSSQTTNHQPTIEDFSILRVYASEVLGVSHIRYSIIQHIAKIFGVKSHVSESFLVIHDENFNNWMSFLLLKGYKARFYTFNYIERKFRSLTKLNSVTRYTSLRFYEEMFESTKFKKHVHEQFYGSDVMSEKYDTSYPRSHIQLPFGVFAYALNFKQIAESTSLTDVRDWEFIEPNLQETLFDFHPNLSFICSQDGLISSAIKSYHSYGLDSKTDHIDRVLLENKPRFFVGDVVFNKRRESYAIVVGYYFSGDVFYRLLQDNATRVVREDNVEAVSNVTSRLHTLITNHYKVGYYFDSFDEKAEKFKPNVHLRKLFPNL